MPFQCVPNFSEGRQQETVAALADSVRAIPGTTLADVSADPDHNRCVLTILGEAEAIRTACLAAAQVAVTRIDLRTHQGVHPRVGALDVLPVVPLQTSTPTQAVALAREIGRDLASRFDLPIYFYEWASRPGHRSALPEIRRGGFETLASLPLTGELAPDLGPSRAHLSAGVTVVGARGPLVAYNINLDTPEVAIARDIARTIRQERGQLPFLAGVRALGLLLASQNRAQVSMNLTQPDRSPLPEVFDFVAGQAAKYGFAPENLESEIIGLIPQSALAGHSPESIRWHTFKPTQILDTWLTGKSA